MVQLPPWLPAPEQVAIPVAFLLSLLLVWVLDRPQGRWGRRLRSRFLLGVPWGTLISAGGILAVYLFVQDGWNHWYNPVTLPFSSWSYFYPTGWLLGPFSHSGPGHLIGNLTTTLAVAPLAEYFFGHYPSKRGANPFASRATNPWVRAFVLFPAGVLVVGIATSLFAWGPIIGFSGVVFAFIGFALVRYPLLTVVALSVQGVVRTVYHALQRPVVIGSASPSFGPPWWFGIAVQGHVLGLLLGVLLGVVLLYRRRERPDALRVWTGTVVVGVSMTLWALWWYRGQSSYVLYRGLGVIFVFVLAALTTVAATADRRPFFGDSVPLLGGSVALLGDFLPASSDSSTTFGNSSSVSDDSSSASSNPSSDSGDPSSTSDDFSSPSDESSSPLANVSRQQVGLLLLLLPLAAMVGVALPVNATTLDDASVPGDGPAVEVRGYTVTYAENVQNQKISVVDVSLFGESTNVTTSGVIVVNEEREIWAQSVSKGRLAFTGRVRVKVGGLGWSEVVTVQRRGWSVLGGPTTYQVWLRAPDDGDWTHTYSSDPAVAGPTLANRTIAILPREGEFFLAVRRNNTTVAQHRIPDPGEAITLDGIRFEREGRNVFAVYDGTRIQIATREKYN